MSPPGLLLTTLLGAALVLERVDSTWPWPPAIFIAAFVVLERRQHALAALRFAVSLVAPLAVYLVLVWVVVVGHPPAGGLLLTRGSASAGEYVLGVSVRLFLLVLLLRAALHEELDAAPLLFMRDSGLPAGGKAAVVMTLSLTSTMRVSASKAWSSLVAANLATPRLSWRNVRNLPVLLLTVWMFTLGTLAGRMQCKWRAEDMRERLAEVLRRPPGKRFSMRDLVWSALGVALLLA